MLSWAITFLIIAITAVGIAKILCFVFLVLFIVSLFMGQRTPPV
jgi:uncharacterized membrane protein YtjA (UPF0391 family)